MVVLHQNIPGDHVATDGWNCWCEPQVLWIEGGEVALLTHGATIN